MFPNASPYARPPLRHSAEGLLGVLSVVGLGLASSLLGLVFVGLLPFVGLALLIVVALRAATRAVPGWPPRPTASAPLCGNRFAC